MKIRYFTILATLAFLGFSATAAAHPCERHEDKSDKHCAVKDGPQSTFTVNMALGNSPTSLVFCDGYATGRNLGPNVEKNLCRITLEDDGPFADSVDVCSRGAAVSNTARKTSVMIFMGTCPEDLHTDDLYADAVWRTLELAATVVIPDPSIAKPGEFRIVVTVPEEGAELKKNHQPYKEVPLKGKIFVGDMVYIPDQ